MSFQGCGIRLLSTFPHITAAHPFVGCPASTCRATRQITDGECERDEKDGSGLVGTHSGHRRVNIGQRRIRRVDPTHPRPPPRINHYANNILQYVSICLVSLVPDPPQIWMNAAISLSIIPTLAPASEARAPYVEARVALLDLYQWTRVWMIQWMTDWMAAPTHP